MNKTDRIINFEGEKHNINNLQTDYLAETVIANMIEKGYEAYRTIIIRNGGYNHSYANDIDKIEPFFSQNDLFDYLCIYTNRPGIYDKLPESLFHHNSSGKIRKSKDDVIDQIRTNKSRAANARMFFKPLEISFDDVHIAVQMKERRIDKKNIFRDYITIFKQYWPVIQLLPTQQAVYFLKVIPVLKAVINDYNKLSKILTDITSFPITVKEGKITTVEYNGKENVTGLGNCKLSRSFIIGNKFTEGYHSVDIFIGPVDKDNIEYFMAGNNGELILNALIDQIFPCYKEIQKHLLVKHEQSNFIMGGEISKGSRLGINTRLKRLGNSY